VRRVVRETMVETTPDTSTGPAGAADATPRTTSCAKKFSDTTLHTTLQTMTDTTPIAHRAVMNVSGRLDTAALTGPWRDEDRAGPVVGGREQTGPDGR